MRLSDYINNVVATRRLPVGTSRPPKVVMKLDVEGRETAILADLFLNGAIRYVDHIHMDWSDLSTGWDPFVSEEAHRDMKLLREAVDNLLSVARREDLLHVPNITNRDDESYGSYSIDDL